ncbi:carbohydrate ABC transporter permease [Paenibacillus paeoniae]|uniref:Carbohydrate ABC transporter permease n=1 Tax=Paenibacillus paeoniae TaxID=2292705 RepID=A0A371PN62_9BACL|nr:carbohydrate ABC transporter permease [Paenibacillus paeoniae]REK77573.1 carbohydrate ABC transporter permease [Paenibacillus paeoniae]
MRNPVVLLQRTALYAALALLAVAVIFPILYTVLQALLTPEQSSQYPPVLWPDQVYFGNLEKVFSLIPIGTFIGNSFMIATTIMIGQVCIASMAAYAFVYVAFPGKKFWFTLFLTTMMIPWEVTIIPNYLTVKSWDWIDSYQGLTVPFLASAFGVFLLRQFFLQLPRELFEAAKIDGAGHVRHYLTIVLPLSRPALASLSVYVFLQSWNMYLWPLLITNSDGMRTVQIGISMLQFEEMVSWNNVLAGVAVVLLPSLLLLVLGLKQLVRGITAGAVKG